ncbi:MAG: tetratricopeptide repeat protein [Oligoflexales bacterium]
MGDLWECLIVDLTDSGLVESYQETLTQIPEEFSLNVVTDEATALVAMEAGGVVLMVILAEEYSPDVESLLQGYQSKVGCLPDFQAIVCEDAGPRFMVSVFEFGVEQFWPKTEWVERFTELLDRTRETLLDSETTESKTLKVLKSIRQADQEEIIAGQAALEELATYDYRAAMARGRAFEATSNLVEAEAAFSQSKNLNSMCRSADSQLAEVMMVNGKTDEALAIYSKLEKSNPRNASRKAALACIYVEKGDHEMAKKFLKEANALSPKGSKVQEAKAQYYLGTGDMGKAFKLLDQLDEVGPHFAAKLNELGVRLSQAGKGKSALALYQKAHKVVRPELRYKISMNAALACRRLKSYEMALKYLKRCQKEYGKRFEKLDKIEVNLKALISQAAKAGDKQAG